MKDNIYDLIVIGTGTAASVTAMGCRKAGWSVAVIDHQPFGGTCALRGCDPKKMLIAATEVIDGVERMGAIGTVKGELRIDWAALQRHKRSFTDPVPDKREQAYATQGIDAYHGRAQFTEVKREYARRNPHGFAGYDENCWGLTACDGPSDQLPELAHERRRMFGYAARGVPYGPDDGTLGGWAALASLPFAPEIALCTAQHAATLSRDAVRAAVHQQCQSDPREHRPGRLGVDRPLRAGYVREARERDIPVKTFTIPMHEVDRAIADDEEAGFVKIHVKERTDRILGATIVARHASDTINEITLAMVAGVGLRTLARVIHAYPTQAEAIKKATDAYNRTYLTPTIQSLLRRWLKE